MNGSSAINYPSNEQLIGKFHVINVDKLPVNNHEDIIIPQTSSITDESGCASRFQMIRVDRNFGRGRWKVNDYEPPENTSSIPPVNIIENESINISNVLPTIIPIIPAVVTGDSNATSSATLAASAAAAAAFQQQHQRIALNNTPNVVQTANVPPPTGLIHGYPPAALANQPYLLPNHHHHQFGYYTFYSPYSPYAPPWGPAALAASNPYLQSATLAPLQQQTTANLNDPNRIIDTVSDINNENTFSNLTTDSLQHAQLAAFANYLYGTQPTHPAFVSQGSSTASSYATIPSYHPVQHPPTILPPQTLPLSQIIPNNTTDIQQFHQVPILISPKHDSTKNLLQQSPLITTPKTKPLVATVFNGNNNEPIKTTHVNDLISSSLISPINMPTTNASTASLSDIWTYTTTCSPLNLTQTAQTTAVVAMNLLNNDTSQNTEIANEILKELTTPTKQNNFSLLERRACLRLRRQLSTTDIDNKISAAMDLVKMHLLSAVREEVTELRQQIRTLNEKVNSIEHENVFLRQHVPSEIYAQYISPFVALSSSNDSTNSTTNTISSILPSSSQPVPITSLSTIPSSLVQQSTLSTNQQAPLSTTNIPLT